jgi:hypothetical protein
MKSRLGCVTAVRITKAIVVAFAIMIATWSMVHFVFLVANVPQYELVPLPNNPVAYSNAVVRFSNPTLLNHVRIPVLLGNHKRCLAPGEEHQVRWLVAERFWLRPRKIERIEVSSSNEVYVVVRPWFGRVNTTLLMKKEDAKWIILAGEATWEM